MENEPTTELNLPVSFCLHPGNTCSTSASINRVFTSHPKETHRKSAALGFSMLGEQKHHAIKMIALGSLFSTRLLRKRQNDGD